jgi:hypothetical protein
LEALVFLENKAQNRRIASYNSAINYFFRIKWGDKMSFFDSLTSGSKLQAAIKQTTKARTKEGAQADFLFKEAYSSFATLLSKHTGAADILYNWGFALLHDAQTRKDDQAISLFEEACEKFSNCLTVKPDYLGAAIDGGVASMALAEAMKAKPDDGLYESAKAKFLMAESIQKGSASYNLACIYGLRGEDEACQEFLKQSRDFGSLPETENILGDLDLKKVRRKVWFKDFIKSLNKVEESTGDEAEASKSPSPEKKQEPESLDSKKVVKKQVKSRQKKSKVKETE